MASTAQSLAQVVANNSCVTYNFHRRRASLRSRKIPIGHLFDFDGDDDDGDVACPSCCLFRPRKESSPRRRLFVGATLSVS
mmetsp:Transcript_10828/g.23017  ORF Transcript_10828/g.23017 Transcript_10828/m.23017 type:complete len:81 (-) Transcript_10828:380-622(-)